MSMHDDRGSLSDMQDHACEAVALLGVKGRDELARDRVLQLALTQLVQIVGEAANRVSVKFRSGNPEIPWQKIVGMRNRLGGWGCSSSRWSRSCQKSSVARWT